MCKSPKITYNGSLHPKILVVGSHPSIQDDKTKRLFSGEDGKKLKKMFTKVGINLAEVGYTNVISCYTEKKPTAEYVRCCNYTLQQTVKKHSKNVEITILVGALATKTFLQKTDMNKLAGKIHRIGGTYFLPMVEPSKKQSIGKVKQAERDLQKALALVNLDVDSVIHWESVDAKRLTELKSEILNAKVLTFDCETSSLDMNDPLQFIIGVGFCYDTKAKKGCFVALEHTDLKIDCKEYSARIKLLREIMLSDVPLRAFNGGFDLAWTHKFLDVDIDSVNYVSDSMHEHHFIKETVRGGTLENLTLDYLPDMGGYDANVDVLKVKYGVQFACFPLEAIAPYCVGDCIATARLSEELFDAKLKKEGSWNLYKNIVIPVVPIYAKMSMNGLKLDTGYATRLQESYGRKVPELKSKCEELVKYKLDVGKPSKMAEYCYARLGLPEQTETKTSAGGNKQTSLSVGKKAIKTLLELGNVSLEDKNFLRAYADYKKLDTINTRYAQKWKTWIGKDGLVHPNYRLTGTKTGRISTSNPNFAQLSNSEADTSTDANRFLHKWPVRRMVISRFPNGKIVEVDYSQLELRIFGMVSGDSTFLATYRDGANGGDLHLSAAKIKFPDFDEVSKEVQKQYRTSAKAVNFGGAYSLNEEFLNTYEGLKEYIKVTKNFAIGHGYVESKLGRRRRIPALRLSVPDKETWKMTSIEKEKFYRRLGALRQACNFTIQSLGHDILMEGLLGVQRRLREDNFRAMLVLEIHDALVVDSPEEEAEDVAILIKEEMVAIGDKYAWMHSIPLVADMEIGDNLEDLVKFEGK